MNMVQSAVPLIALIATAAGRSPAPRYHPPAHSPASAVPSTVVVTATDFAYTGAPAEVAAGWVTIRMVNRGRELHMLAMFNVPRGFSSATMIDSMVHGHFLSGAHEWGGPNAVAPGASGTVMVYLEPGSYVFGCFVQSADGKTHFVKGMLGSLRATAASSPAPAPASLHSITLSTYAIGMTGPQIRAGVDTLRVRNTARERHDLVVLRVAPGHTVTDALAWFTNPPTGAPTATPVVGTTALHTNEDVYLAGHFTPGTYVLVCWMYTNGKVHHQLGMKRVFTVTS